MQTLWLREVDKFFHESIPKRSFKAGLFQYRITRHTPIKVAFNILITSPLLKLPEKMAVIAAKKYYLLFSSGKRAHQVTATIALDALKNMLEQDSINPLVIPEMVGTKEVALVVETGAPAGSDEIVLVLEKEESALTETPYWFELANWEKEAFDWFQHVRDGVMKGIFLFRFKDGAFIKAVKKATTPTVKALNILLGSSLTTTQEKEVIRKARDNISAIVKRFQSPPGAAQTSKPRAADVEAISGSIAALWAIFQEDAKARSQYAPPLYFQSFSETDCTVLETYVFNADNTVTILPGGDPYVPPGATIQYIEENKDEIAKFREAYLKAVNASWEA